MQECRACTSASTGHRDHRSHAAFTTLALGILRLSSTEWLTVAQEVLNDSPGADFVTETFTVDVMAPQDAAAPVDTGEEGDVRLVGTVEVNGYVTGALQVFCDGQWGAVCNSNFNNSDALVACRQLGFSTGAATGDGGVLRQRRFATSDDPVLEPFSVENLGCRGNESRILDCPVEVVEITDYNEYYANTGICSPFLNTYAFVACGTLSSAEEGDVRLEGGTTAVDGSAELGRLEIFHRGGWGSVCVGDDVVKTSTLTVACRALGYDGGAQVRPELVESNLNRDRVPIHVTARDLRCTGSEASLEGCPGFRLGTAAGRSQSSGPLSVLCFTSTNSSMDGQARLEDGQSGPGYEYGRLEVFRRGFWGNVGVADFSNPVNDALTLASVQVACSDVGFDGGAVLRFVVPYLAASRMQILPAPLLLSVAGTQCEGQEESLLDCPRTSDAEIAEEYGYFGADFSGTVVACGTTSAGCEERAVEDEGAVRLRGGSGTPCDALHSGFVEIRHNGEWGRICLQPFESRDEPVDTLVADVACRQLGFPHGTLVIPGSGPDGNTRADPSDPGTVLLTGVECRGVEAAVTGCNTGQGFLTNTSECPVDPETISLQLHVACRQFPVLEALEALTTPGAEEGDVRLVNMERVANWVTGDLQLFFDGAWGQLCSGIFSGRDADVTCRQLGFAAGSQAYPTTGGDMDFRGFPEVVLARSGCNGTEASLLECRANAGTDTYDYSFCGSTLRLACVDPEVEGAEGALRLAGGRDGPAGENVSGMVEIFHAGAWGTLCRLAPLSRDMEYDVYGRIVFAQSFSEESADVACQQLGFVAGFLEEMSTDDFNTTSLPPWLSDLQCNGSEAAVSDCVQSEFGDTGLCSTAQQLTCVRNRNALPPEFRTRDRVEDISDARLVGGRADPQGRWEYGRLEILADGVWIPLDDQSSTDNFGRRGAQVACRTLGYATGAQLLAGADSILPSLSTNDSAGLIIVCGGREETLANCTVIDFGLDFGTYFDSGNAGQVVDDIALVCTNPTDCEPNDGGMPVEGDVRLVALPGNSPATAACDDVHFGRVEIFHDGLWGRICGGEEEDFTLDSAVVCRQLGFPFGSVLDEDRPNAFELYKDDYSDYGSISTLPVWATQVVCLGKEGRLLECAFPENFGSAVESDLTDDDYLSQAAASPASTAAPGPGPGLPGACSFGISDFSVVCRRFEITESDVIRG